MQPPASPSCKVYELEAVGPTPQRENAEEDIFFIAAERAAMKNHSAAKAAAN
jgi:hypothetical protein